MPDSVTTLDGLMKLNSELDAAKAAAETAKKEVGQAERRAAKKAEALKAAQTAYDKARSEVEAAIAKAAPSKK